MATVDVTVGGRQYQLACEDGQERHLAALAAMVDAEARALASQIGVVGEPRLLLMAALMIADRLRDAEQQGAPQPDTAAAERAAEKAAEKAAADAQALETAVARLEGLIDAHAARA